MDLFFAALPIGFLIFVMTKKNGLPSTVAFALAALLTYLIRLWYFKTSPNLAHAAILSGLLSALTPISIVFGAIFFFVALERSGAMRTLSLWLDGVSSNPVAQLMIVGWSFIFLIEGASGFGTPAALAAPILVGLGFPPLRVAVLCIVMNAVPTSFGAVGTPTWFGFGSLGLAESQLLEIGLKAALIHAVAALIIPVIGLRFVVDWKEIRRNLLFVELAILASVIPMAAVAAFNYEFPSVVGGMIGLLTTIFLAQRGIGLAKDKANTVSSAAPSSQSASPQTSAAILLRPGDVLRALAPLLATVGILLLTRIPFFGLRQLLTSEGDWVLIPVGRLGDIFSQSFSCLSVAGNTGRKPSLVVRASVRSVHPSILCRCSAGSHTLSLPAGRFWAGRKRDICTSPESGSRPVRGPDYCAATHDRRGAGIYQDSR